MCRALMMWCVSCVLIPAGFAFTSQPATGQDAIKATPPPDWQQRRGEYEGRNSPERLAELAQRLASMIDLGSPGIRDGFAAHFEQGEYAAALDAYRDFVLAKLREPASYDVPDFCIVLSDLEPVRKKQEQTDADELLANVVTVRDLEHELKVDVGEPGAINWLFTPDVWKDDPPIPPGELPWRRDGDIFSDNMWLPPNDVAWQQRPGLFARHFRRPAAFTVLLKAYLETGDRRYLDKWAAYIDDWCLNQQRDADSSPYNIQLYRPQEVEHFDRLVGRLAYLVRHRESFAQHVSAPTLVRLLMRRLPEATAATNRIQYFYEGNWRYFLGYKLVRVGVLFDEFKISERLIREGLRGSEIALVRLDLPDGTDYEVNPSYWGCLHEWMAWPLWQMAENYEHPVLTPQYVNEHFREPAIRRTRNQLAFQMPNGRWPIYGIQDERQQLAEFDCPRVRDFIPEFFEAPDVASRLNRAFAGETPRYKSAVFGDGRTDEPSYQSEALPYAGIYFLRGGWNPDSPFGFLKNTGHIIATGVDNYHWQNNNSVHIFDYGQELLFDHHETPVTVDGCDQNVRHMMPIGGHLGYMLPKPILPRPASRRWSDSDRFAFAEATYDGPYGHPTEHFKSWLRNEAPGQDIVINDVAHQRQVLLIKPLRLWIVVDRLSSQKEHEFTQKWMLHLNEEGGYGPIYGFATNEIAVDGAAGTVRTSRPGGPNISLYQIGPRGLELTSVLAPPNAVEVQSWNNEGRDERYMEKGSYLWSYSIHRVNSTFKGKGEHVLISLVYPRQSVDVDLEDVKAVREKGLIGFDALLPNGETVRYRCALDRDEVIDLDGAVMQGESLVLADLGGGTRYGLALGARKLEIDEAPRLVETGDVEFTISPNGYESDTIYRRLEPVRFEPDVASFTESVDIIMSSETPGVMIRYTLDGSDPTTASPLYAGPVQLTESTTVKAKAFRKGTTPVSWTFTGVDATVATVARYRKLEYQPAASVEPGRLVRGIDYHYYETHWRDFMLQFDTLTPLKDGVAGDLMDISTAERDRAFGFEYTGYFEVPRDGVYTFYAPHPMYQANEIHVDPGYLFELSLNGRRWQPGTSHHGFGMWSVALKAGMHPIAVRYADFRGGKEDVYFPNRAYHCEWTGDKPKLLISGPGLDKQPLTDRYLWRIAKEGESRASLE